jgi:hypothetical protein
VASFLQKNLKLRRNILQGKEMKFFAGCRFAMGVDGRGIYNRK